MADWLVSDCCACCRQPVYFPGLCSINLAAIRARPANLTTDPSIWHKRMNLLKKAFAFARLFG